VALRATELHWTSPSMLLSAAGAILPSTVNPPPSTLSQRGRSRPHVPPSGADDSLSIPTVSVTAVQRLGVASDDSPVPAQSTRARARVERGLRDHADAAAVRRARLHDRRRSDARRAPR